MKKRRTYSHKNKVWQWPHLAISSAPPLSIRAF